MIRAKGRSVLIGMGIAVAVLVVAWIGYSIGGQMAGTRFEYVSEGGVAPEAAPDNATMSYGTAVPPAAESPETKGSQASDESGAGRAAATQSLIIRNSSMDVRVESMDDALAAVRAAVANAGAEIADLSVSAGDQNPTALDAGGSSQVRGPATAFVTIRVAAERLAALEEEIGSLGTVQAQSSSASDVTEQAIDMKARLKNLRAEEARLRSFLSRTNKVSELLEVERELARVRGEIESMDAQLTYLERQAARATLVVTLSEPAPVVQPEGTSWGLREAVTRGIQATVALFATLVTVAIPLLVFGGLLLVIYVPVRALLRRRTVRKRAGLADDTGTPPEAS